MKTSGWCSNGARHTRINSLVFEGVRSGVWTLYIGWKRHMTVRFENLVDVRCDAKEPQAVILFDAELSFEFSPGKDDPIAFANTLAGPDHHFPDVFACRRRK